LCARSILQSVNLERCTHTPHTHTHTHTHTHLYVLAVISVYRLDDASDTEVGNFTMPLSSASKFMACMIESVNSETREKSESFY
jgi:hypothetical protein